MNVSDPGPTTAIAVAPASVGNVAVGFDLLGHTIEVGSDRVTLRRLPEPTVRLASIQGSTHPLSVDPAANSATAGLLRLIEDHRLPFGFEATLRKGIPPGSGMGGSAASAVAGVLAANALLPRPLPRAELLRYTLIGEAAASGAAHGDNLAASLMGGMVLVRALDPPDLIPISVPEPIRCVLVHPQLQVETRAARQLLPREVPLQASVAQAANLAGFLTGCFTGDLQLIGRSLQDVLVEPHRATLVPGFHAVQRAALAGGALGCSLSGAGPSLFAWCADAETAATVRQGMLAAFAAEGIRAQGWISPIRGRGARVAGVA